MKSSVGNNANNSGCSICFEYIALKYIVLLLCRWILISGHLRISPFTTVLKYGIGFWFEPFELDLRIRFGFLKHYLRILIWEFHHSQLSLLWHWIWNLFRFENFDFDLRIFPIFHNFAIHNCPYYGIGGNSESAPREIGARPRLVKLPPLLGANEISYSNTAEISYLNTCQISYENTAQISHANTGKISYPNIMQMYRVW